VSLAGAAAATGLPESLVERSAQARSAETGTSVDEILAAWAGGETVAATSSPEPATPASPEPAETPVPEVVAAEPVPVVATVETPAPVAAIGPGRLPIPDEVSSAEAAHLPEVITVPTAGIKERTNFVIPRWLTVVLLAVPLFALFALGGASTGQCGEATELLTDVVTGEIVNCDLSAFTGQPVGGGTDFIRLGGDIYAGVAVTGVNCSGCHGATGQGTATFPSLAGELTTFGACTDHIEWVTLGSSGFSEIGTYGDTAKPVSGGMPSFSGILNAEQIAAVSVFERVRFGGQNPEEAVLDCGLLQSGEETVPATEGGDDLEATTSHSG
jgi:hypothetical protein